MVKKLIPLLFLLFLIQISFSWWVENITIYVGDNKGRPIKNSSVSIIYQSTSCDKHNVIEKKTDENGYANFYFMNMVEEPSECVERSYIINIEYFGIKKKEIGIVGERKKYTYFIEAAQAKINVVGYNNITLPFSKVILSGIEYYTDARGIVSVPIPIGKEIPVDVWFGNISKSTKILIRGDEEVRIELPVYDLKIFLYDENGKRISGKVIVENRVAFVETEKEGIIEKFPYPSAKFKVIVENKSKEFEMKINSDLLEIYVDLSPPMIRDVKVVEVKEKNVKITSEIFDPGKHSSGIKNIFVYYKFLNGSELSGKMYLAGKNFYEATIPSRGNDFSYEIVAIDNQGNENKYVGNYSFGKKEEKKEIKFEMEMQPVLIVGILVFIIVIVFVYKKIREAVQ